MNFFEDTDFIFTRGPAGRIQSGGFTILNRLLKTKVHPMYTINQPSSNTTNEIKNVSSLFEGFVVPIGLQVPPYNQSEERGDNSSKVEEEEEEEEERDLYDSLLAFAETVEPNSSTFKRKSTVKQLKQPLQSKTKKIKPSKQNMNV